MDERVVERETNIVLGEISFSRLGSTNLQNGFSTTSSKQSKRWSGKKEKKKKKEKKEEIKTEIFTTTIKHKKSKMADLKKFTTTLHIYISHDINTVPFPKLNICNVPSTSRERSQAQENWYWILIYKMLYISYYLSWYCNTKPL